MVMMATRDLGWMWMAGGCLVTSAAPVLWLLGTGGAWFAVKFAAMGAMMSALGGWMLRRFETWRARHHHSA